MSSTPHQLLAEIPRRLRLQPQWVEHRLEGTAFVVTETGCWLSIVEDNTLHIEVRAALDVRDIQTAVSFCDERNHFALVGRWLYDAEAGVVALVADLPLPPTPAYDVESVAKELVAEMINAVATVQFTSAAQRDLGARKAIPALRGKVRQTRNRTDEHLPRHTYPRGATSEVAHSALILTQDVLLEPLLDWDVEHQDGQTIADHEDGSRLVLQVAQHPHAGWGLVVSLRPAWTIDAHGLNELNARSAQGLGHWTQVQDTVEHRVFLTSALLEAAEAKVWAPAQLVTEVVTSVAGQRNRTSFMGTALQRPFWPDDDVGEIRARRDPWNDARDDDDPEWYAIYLDLFGRMGTLTEPSYLRWLAALTKQDLIDLRTAGFISFMEARISDRQVRETQGVGT